MGKSNFGRGVGVFFLSALAGCVQLTPDLMESEQALKSDGQNEAVSKTSPDAPSNDILSFAISAEVDETRTLNDALKNESILITAGIFYHAASGKLCRKFTEETIKNDMRQHICNSRVVCHSQAGNWYQVRQIINIYQPEKDIVKCAESIDLK